MKKLITIVAATIVFATITLSLKPQDQPNGVKRTDLLKHDLTPGNRELVQARVDIEPGALAPNHSHPGEEFVYVLEGVLEYQLEGRPPVKLKAGEVLFIPAGVVHSARNTGKKKGSELATYTVEKGKPLVVYPN